MAIDQTIFIVEDDAAVRDSLGLLLSQQGYRIQSFESGEKFLAVCETSWVGCLLLDIRMPNKSGLELQAELNAKGIALPIIIVSAYGDVSKTKTAFKAGAVDFLEKPVDPDDILEAVRRALNVAEKQHKIKKISDKVEQILHKVSPRERQVLDLVCAGQDTRAVASILNISPRTVEAHKESMLKKLHVRNTSELISIVLSAARPE